MKIFGYSKSKVNDNGLLELDEITFQADSKTLKAVANFLVEMAGRIETNPNGFDHGHLQDQWQEWKDDFPDVIVAE